MTEAATTSDEVTKPVLNLIFLKTDTNETNSCTHEEAKTSLITFPYFFLSQLVSQVMWENIDTMALTSHFNSIRYFKKFLNI
jgi:hypothetical protein